MRPCARPVGGGRELPLFRCLLLPPQTKPIALPGRRAPMTRAAAPDNSSQGKEERKASQPVSRAPSSFLLLIVPVCSDSRAALLCSLFMREDYRNKIRCRLPDSHREESLSEAHQEEEKEERIRAAGGKKSRYEARFERREVPQLTWRLISQRLYTRQKSHEGPWEGGWP